MERLFGILEEESKSDGFFYNVNRLCVSKNLPKVVNVVSKLTSKGFLASRTHFDPLCVRTNANVNVLKELINEDSS